MEIPHDYVLITPGNFTSFLLTPGICTLYFFITPGNSMSSNPPVWIFSGIAHGQNPELISFRDYRAVSYLNFWFITKFDMMMECQYQTIVQYMKFPKEVVVGANVPLQSPVLNLFCPVDHLTTVYPELFHICLYYMTLNLT